MSAVTEHAPEILGALVGTAELVGLYEDGSPEWHEARGQVIGSSDIATILGLSQWKSKLTLHYEKRGLIAPAEPSPEQQELFDYGHHMEQFIAGLFQARHPELNVYDTGSWRHTERLWQGCNPDRLLDDAVLELKTGKSKADWEDGVPANYEAQLRWQMDTFGFRHGWIAAWFSYGGYAEYYFEADDFIAESYRQAAIDFNRGVDEGIEPEIDGSESSYMTLRRLNPSIVPKSEIVVPEHIGDEYLKATAEFAAAEKEALRMKGHLLAHAGTAQYIFHNGQKIARRQARGNGVPWIVEA